MEKRPVRNIALCGIKHSGKTCAGRAAARLLGIRFRDTDDVLAEEDARRNGLAAVRPVRTIYRALGEEAFRRLEADAVRLAASDAEPHVLALGGGVLSNPYLTEGDVASRGFICCLDISDEAAFERIRPEGLPPFLASEPDPFAAFRESNRARREIFGRFAHKIIHPDPDGTPEETAERIVSAWKEACG